MVNTQLLEKRIVNSGKTKSFLAERLGITLQAFRRKCVNKSEFWISEALVLALELGITTFKEFEKIFFAQNVDQNSTEDYAEMQSEQKTIPTE